VYFVVRRRKHLENCGAGLGIKTAQDPEYGLTLWGRGPLIDNRLNLPMPLWIAPGQDTIPTNFKPSSFVSPCSLLDVTAEHGMTVSVSRQGVKLTRAAIGAATVIKFPSFKHPLEVGHSYPSPQHSTATARMLIERRADMVKKSSIQ
jgi:hypothetical protein